MSIWTDTTRALRERSPEMLRRDLLAMLRGSAGDDARDVMMNMAPYHHCARQLGLNPRELFDEVAAGLGDEMADLVRGFGARRDVRARSFRFVLEATPDGPRYRAM